MLCNAPAQPSLGTGEDWGLPWHGEGLETPTTPLPGSFRTKERPLQVLLWGVPCFPLAPGFASSRSCASSQAMGALSRRLVPPCSWYPAVQKQKWGPLLLSCCGNGLGSASPSSWRPPLPREEREGLSLERAPHRQGLDLPMLVFALSKTALPAADWDG